MPRSKQGKTREKIDVEALSRAVTNVLQNNTKIRTAARNFGVSRTTLTRHLLKHRAIPDQLAFKYEARSDVKRIFSNVEELELVECCKQAARLHHGLIRKGILNLAFEYANKNNIIIPPNWKETKSAGYMWLRGLRKRYPRLSLRKPEPTSLARATSFNHENVSAFFKNLKEVLTRHNFSSRRIYNLDETGNSTVHVPPKILCAKGTKQVGNFWRKGYKCHNDCCNKCFGNCVVLLV
jgi:transposase-like protein